MSQNPQTDKTDAHTVIKKILHKDTTIDKSADINSYKLTEIAVQI